MRRNWLVSIILTLAIASTSQVARAQDGEACSVAYARGQEERLAGRLYNARSAFQQCAVEACSAIAGDCERWLKEVEADLPTLRVTVRDELGRPVEQLRVSIDDTLVSE